MWRHRERLYYTFPELMDFYSISRAVLDNRVLNGALTAHTWIQPCCAEAIVEVQSGNQILLTKTDKIWEGYGAIFPNDYRKILQRGHSPLREFKGQDSEMLRLKNGAPDIMVHLEDIVILARDRDGLDEYFGFSPDATEATVEVLGRIAPVKRTAARADPSFRHVTFEDEEFLFGTVQAAVVKQLYDSAKAGDPWVNGKKILGNAGSEGNSLRNIFARKKNWRKLIESDSRGYYRLNEKFVASVSLSANDHHPSIE